VSEEVFLGVIATKLVITVQNCDENLEISIFKYINLYNYNLYPFFNSKFVLHNEALYVQMENQLANQKFHLLQDHLVSITHITIGIPMMKRQVIQQTMSKLCPVQSHFKIQKQ
jgi:hypothetical protein